MTRNATTRPRQNMSRWAAWESEVLSKVEHFEECQEVIRQRQNEIDDDKSEAEGVEAQFVDELQRRGHDPDRHCLFIPSATAAAWLEAATRTRWPTNRATSHIDGLGIRQLSKSKREGRPGWRWQGLCAPERPMMPLNALPEPPAANPAANNNHRPAS